MTLGRGTSKNGLDDLPGEKSAREAIAKQGCREKAAIDSGSWWHSIELGGGYVTPGVKTLEELRENYASLELPDDLGEKRVLDVGCWDGFYSFEAERHGAQVVAIDCFRPENFMKAHSTLKSKVEFREMSVYELSRKQLGTFDIVLFLGVLYHLRHPLLGLERLCEVTRDFAFIESHVTDDFFIAPNPIMEFYEFEQLGGRYDNWWGPSSECLVQMIRASGFPRVEILRRESTRAAIKACRNWVPNPALEVSPSIFVSTTFNPVTWNHEVPISGRNAFLGMYAKGLPENVTRESLRVHVGSFGIGPHFVGDSQYPCYKQINLPVPPGLDPGTTTVWIETGSQRSNGAEVQLVEGQEW